MNNCPVTDDENLSKVINGTPLLEDSLKSKTYINSSSCSSLTADELTHAVPKLSNSRCINNQFFNGENSILSESNHFINSIIDSSPKNAHIEYFEDITCLYKCSNIFENNDTFLKGCKWSPDDSFIVTNDSSNTVSVFALPDNLRDVHEFETCSISDFLPELSFKPGGIVYDFEWGPLLPEMTQYSLFTVTNLGPVYLCDISNGDIKASYMMYNDKEESVHAMSVTYSQQDGTIYTGTIDSVYIFDINRPGNNASVIKDKNFKRAIISTISVNPINPKLFAIGTYNKKIGIFDERSLLAVFTGMTRGITELKFSTDGVLLYSGMRGNGDIICWDLRQPGIALYKMERTVNTQQRIYFDLSADGRHLISGSTDGKVYIWETEMESSTIALPPVKEFYANGDCTNGVSMCGSSPILATTSGQYHYSSILVSEDSDEENEHTNQIENPKISKEYSLKLWWLGKKSVPCSVPL